MKIITTTMIGIIAIVEIITNQKRKGGWWEWRLNRIIRWIITIMKNDKKNRRNENSMTQDYDYNQIDDNNSRNDDKNDDEINYYGW